MCFFFCVSLFCSTKINYTAEKSGDLNRAKLWGQEVPREENVAKVDEVRKRINKPKTNKDSFGSSLFFCASGGCKLFL